MSIASYVYNLSLPLPPEASPETLEVLARVRGTGALDELQGAVNVLDAELKSVHRKMTGGAIRENLERFQDTSERRRRYVVRSIALTKHLKIKPPSFAPPPALPDIVRIMAKSAEGQDLRGQLATMLAALRADHDAVAAELASFVGSQPHLCENLR